MARVNHFPLSTHRLRIYCRPFNLELFGSILADRRNTPVIDVLDMDIQGGESILSEVDKTYPLLWDLMCKKVKKVIIGTHNKFTHEAIVETFLGRKRKGYELGAAAARGSSSSRTASTATSSSSATTREMKDEGTPAGPFWELIAEMPHRHAVQTNISCAKVSYSYCHHALQIFLLSQIRITNFICHAEEICNAFIRMRYFWFCSS